MRISFRGIRESIEVGIDDKSYSISLSWQVSPAVDQHDDMDLDVLTENYLHFKEDLTRWIDEHLEGKTLTNQENVDRKEYFIMDHPPTFANLPVYLLEILVIRARPFGLSVVYFEFKEPEGAVVVYEPGVE